MDKYNMVLLIRTYQMKNKRFSKQKNRGKRLNSENLSRNTTIVLPDEIIQLVLV